MAVQRRNSSCRRQDRHSKRVPNKRICTARHTCTTAGLFSLGERHKKFYHPSDLSEVKMNPTTIRQYSEASLKLEVLKLRGKALNEMIAREERYANVLMKCVGVVFVVALIMLIL